MTVVRYGFCPVCGVAVTFGASVYHDTGMRVVPCSCGTRAAPVPTQPARLERGSLTCAPTGVCATFVSFAPANRGAK
jgi:hypothetical protein